MRIPKTSNAAMGTMMWKANMAVAESKASVPVMSRIAASSLERLRLTRSAGGLDIFMMMVFVVCLTWLFGCWLMGEKKAHSRVWEWALFRHLHLGQSVHGLAHLFDVLDCRNGLLLGVSGAA